MEAESTSSGHRRQKRPRQRRSSEVISYENSVANLSKEGKETLMIVSRRRQLNKIPNTSCTVFDNTCPRYNWLRSGWIAEERLKPHDRLYRVIILFFSFDISSCDGKLICYQLSDNSLAVIFMQIQIFPTRLTFLLSPQNSQFMSFKNQLSLPTLSFYFISDFSYIYV